MQNPGADTTRCFFSSLSSSLTPMLEYLTLNLPSGHMPFRSVYNRGVGCCYELHCDEALCKPSLSVRLSSVCLWFVVACVFLCYDSFPSAHSAHCVSISGFRVSLGKGCHSCVAPGPRTVLILRCAVMPCSICLSSSWSQHRRQILLSRQPHNELKTLISQKHSSHEAFGKSPLIATVLSKY